MNFFATLTITRSISNQFYLFRFIFPFIFWPWTSVSTLEKSSKQSPSAPSVTPSTIKAHDDNVKITATSVASDSHSVPLANSLDLSSDDDHLDKLTGASSSTTTTSSSLFDANKRVSSFDEGLKPLIAPLSIVDQIKASNTSINKLDYDFEGTVVNDTSMRYRVEQQRKCSIPNINNNQEKAGSENKVNIDCFKCYQNFSMMINYPESMKKSFFMKTIYVWVEKSKRFCQIAWEKVLKYFLCLYRSINQSSRSLPANRFPIQVFSRVFWIIQT